MILLDETKLICPSLLAKGWNGERGGQWYLPAVDPNVIANQESLIVFDPFGRRLPSSAIPGKLLRSSFLDSSIWAVNFLPSTTVSITNLKQQISLSRVGTFCFGEPYPA